MDIQAGRMQRILTSTTDRALGSTEVQEERRMDYHLVGKPYDLYNKDEAKIGQGPSTD